MPRVGGKEYPYTKAGMAAAKKAAAKKTSNSSSREAMQKKNRGAAIAGVDSRNKKSNAMWAARSRTTGPTDGVKSNRIRSNGAVYGDAYTIKSYNAAKNMSDALKGGYRAKQGSTGAMKSRMNARKKGAR